jgi:hypothetical protein
MPQTSTASARLAEVHAGGLAPLAGATPEKPRAGRPEAEPVERSASTVRALRHRLTRPLSAFGAVPLRELEGMSGDLADFRATLPPRFAHDVMRALRQTLAAGVRYGYLSSNPAVAAGDNQRPRLARCAPTPWPSWKPWRPS